VQITKGEYELWRPVWSPDGTRIAYDFNEGPNPGTRHIGMATINDSPKAARLRLLTGGRGVDVNPIWSPDGRKILYQRSDAQNPADLYVVDTVQDGLKPIRLTDSLPAGGDRTRFVAPELIHYPGPDGKPVPAYLFVPKTLNKAVKHPAIVWVHGDGINQNYDGWHIQRNYAVYYSFHQYLLQKGYVVIAPDYRGSIGYGAKWRDDVHMDVGGKDFKDAGMAANYLKTLPRGCESPSALGLVGGFFTLLAMTDMPTTLPRRGGWAGVADYAMCYEDHHGSWTEPHRTAGAELAVYRRRRRLAHRQTAAAAPRAARHRGRERAVPAFGAAHRRADEEREGRPRRVHDVSRRVPLLHARARAQGRVVAGGEVFREVSEALSSTVS
jgi:dipeptidyl aminopeptidase/acylaminoacyl peptidase